MYIHQIFLDIGKGDLSDRPVWLEHIERNKKLNPNYTHILWDDSKVDKFIEEEVPEYKEMIQSFRNKFYLIDFIRYCILWKYGGIYIDCDCGCKKSIEDIDYILGSFDHHTGENKVNNNVIRFKTKEEYKSLLDFCVSEYNRIIDNDLYKGMPGRHFTNSTGARMFQRFCRKNKYSSDIVFAEYFYDEEGKSWLSAVCNNPVKKKTDGYLSIKNV
jgi:hypothetical protein